MTLVITNTAVYKQWIKDTHIQCIPLAMNTQQQKLSKGSLSATQGSDMSIGSLPSKELCNLTTDVSLEIGTSILDFSLNSIRMEGKSTRRIKIARCTTGVKSCYF